MRWPVPGLAAQVSGPPGPRRSAKSVNLDKVCTISWVKNLQAPSPLAAHALLSAPVAVRKVATHATCIDDTTAAGAAGAPPQAKSRRKF